MITRARSFLICLALAASGCAHESPADSSTGPPTTLWDIHISSESDFGVRVWLDGQPVYQESASSSPVHRVQLQTPFVAGEHVLEFEVVAAAVSPSRYTTAWTVRVRPDGAWFTADGVPTMLGVGERLRIRVPL